MQKLQTSLSDKLKVSTTKLAGKSETKDVDIAIIKATTSQHHVVPKEKHVRTLKLAVGGGAGQRHTAYVVEQLLKRLADSADWLTALKTLVTLHRMIRETDAIFLQALVRSGGGHGGHGRASLAFVGNFIDRTSGEGAGRFDFSEWVRAYGMYLEEQVEVFAELGWHIEQEQAGAESRMRSLTPKDLLFQLPYLQRLQRRLLDCVPRGQAVHDPVVLFALLLVVKESFKLYKAVSEGVINLADAFFEMERGEAARGLELYRESTAANEALSTYYATIEQIEEVRRSMQLPKLVAPPTDFTTSMEAYVGEAPRAADEAGTTVAAGGAKRVPMRKGRLAGQLATTGKQASGDSPAAAAITADPGMLLPSPTAGAAPTAVAPAANATAPTSPSAAAQPTPLEGVAPAAAAATAPPTTVAPAAQVQQPSAMDLLLDLDWNTQPAVAAPAPAAAGDPFVMTAPQLVGDPFALPVQRQPAMPAVPAPSGNPFGF